MPLFTRVTRTSAGTAARTQSTAALQDQFLRELTTQANTLLDQLTQQFSQNLQAQASQLLGDGSDGSSGFGTSGQLFATGAKLLSGGPKIEQTVTESDRSQDANSVFRVSQSQALAEANQMIAKGDKNL